jgi:hypothetical protein
MTPAKSILILAGLLAHSSVTGTTIAQQSGTSGIPKPAAAASHNNADTPETDESLHVTDDQKAKIQAIRADGQQQLAAVQKDAALKDDQKEAKMKLIRKATRKHVWDVLTPEQQKTWALEQRELREAKQKSAKP